MTQPSAEKYSGRLTSVQMAHCLDGLRASFHNAEVVYQGKDRVLVRWRETSSARTLIIKLWSRPDLRGKIRRLLKLAANDHEMRSLQRLQEIGMPVPKPLGACSVHPAISSYTDALFMEDLGKCESSTEHLKQLISEDKVDEATQFEDAIIEMAAQIIKAGMIDVDHGFVNTVIPASGRPVRIDFELARRVLVPHLFPRLYGQMLGHVILLHAFAMQPNVSRSTQFAERLCRRLGPSRMARDHASSYIRKWLAEQSKTRGINTILPLPWELN